MPIGFAKATITSGSEGSQDAVGQQEYTNPGGYWWTAPEGVYSVCAVAVGGGGGSTRDESGAGGGGGLGWKNSISVVPGQSYYVQVGDGSRRGDYTCFPTRIHCR